MRTLLALSLLAAATLGSDDAATLGSDDAATLGPDDASPPHLPKDSFPTGSRVVIHSLQNSAAYNGRKGTVLGPFVGKSGGKGYRVKLDADGRISYSEGGTDTRRAAVEKAYAPKNMRKIAAPVNFKPGDRASTGTYEVVLREWDGTSWKVEYSDGSFGTVSLDRLRALAPRAASPPHSTATPAKQDVHAESPTHEDVHVAQFARNDHLARNSQQVSGEPAWIMNTPWLQPGQAASIRLRLLHGRLSIGVSVNQCFCHRFELVSGYPSGFVTETWPTLAEGEVLLLVLAVDGSLTYTWEASGETRVHPQRVPREEERRFQVRLFRGASRNRARVAPRHGCSAAPYDDPPARVELLPRTDA